MDSYRAVYNSSNGGVQHLFWKVVAMLVLSRKSLESIVIGGDVVVTVLEVRGDKVRLGIEAPRTTEVDRMEIHEQKRQQMVGAGK